VQLTGDGGGKPPALARAARTQPCRAHADQRDSPGHAPSWRVVAPRRGQRRPGSARPRRTAAADRRVGACHRRRSDHEQRSAPPRAPPAPASPASAATSASRTSEGVTSARMLTLPQS
jgi:hypothetical protein